MSASIDVPQIVVTTADGNGTTLEKSDGYVDAHITITGVDGSELEDDIVIKVRGNTTALSFVLKKSFTFKFSKKKDVLGMGKGKKWALVANAFDPTLLRNFLAFETADELGLAYTSQHKYVELWLDGVFRGNYVLFEPVQEGKDRVNIDIESNGGMKDFLLEFESDMAMQYPDDTYFDTSNFHFRVADPEDPNEEQLAYMQNIMADIIDTIKSGDETLIAEKIDLTSFAKYYLLNEYFKTYDFSVTSVYFYYQDGKLYAGPPWDYDLSMGNTKEDGATRCREANSSQGVFADKNFFKYLAHKDWFKELVKSEYLAHIDYFSHMHIDGGILDTIYATYSDTIARNYSSETGWRASKTWINIQRKADSTYEANYNFLKNWLAERHAWFDAYFGLEEQIVLLGDADDDGEVNILDATCIQRKLAALFIESISDEAADADQDGAVTILDATVIQRWLVQLPTNEDIGKLNISHTAVTQT